MFGERQRQRIEDDPAARAVAQVLVHRQPGFERHRERVWQHPDQRLAASGERDLAYADAGAGADHRELGIVAVAADGEVPAADTTEALRRIAQEGPFLVV